MLQRIRLGRQTIIVFAICVSLIVFCNVYFLVLHSKSQQQRPDDRLQPPESAKKSTAHQIEKYSSAIFIARNWSILERKLERRWSRKSFDDLLKHEHLPADGAPPPPPPRPLKEWTIVGGGGFGVNFSTTPAGDVWTMARGWVGAREVYPKQRTERLSTVLRAMVGQPIVRVGAGKGGTQLKLTLELTGGQEVIFKPMRYERETVFTKDPYGGADRHNGEIAAFHLSRLLDFRWVPLAVGRKINLRTEVLPVAKESLRRTFLTIDNNLCFYGVCYYCNPKEPACAKGDIIEGAVILYLPTELNLKSHLHPWRRSYSKAVEPWRLNDNHCQTVKKSRAYRDGPRLLDLIDIAVFDFLIGNADRHHYETFKSLNDSMVILLDNGKSFGTPHEDETSILAPLYQCCTIRKSTWNKLKEFPSRSLSILLSSLLEEDPLHQLLTDGHLLAIDRRRLKVLDVVDFCLEKQSAHSVLL